MTSSLDRSLTSEMNNRIEKMAKNKPRYGSGEVEKLAGHKCLGAVMCFEVNCECGWVSCPHSGDGARGFAYSEWRDHVRAKHKLAAEQSK